MRRAMGAATDPPKPPSSTTTHTTYWGWPLSAGGGSIGVKPQNRALSCCCTAGLRRTGLAGDDVARVALERVEGGAFFAAHRAGEAGHDRVVDLLRDLDPGGRL